MRPRTAGSRAPYDGTEGVAGHWGRWSRSASCRPCARSLATAARSVEVRYASHAHIARPPNSARRQARFSSLVNSRVSPRWRMVVTGAASLARRFRPRARATALARERQICTSTPSGIPRAHLGHAAAWNRMQHDDEWVVARAATPALRRGEAGRLSCVACQNLGLGENADWGGLRVYPVSTRRRSNHRDPAAALRRTHRRGCRSLVATLPRLYPEAFQR